MKRNGLSRVKRGSGTDPAPSPKSPGDAPGAGPADLELEKRWLQLVRVDAERFKVFFDKYHDPLFTFLTLKTGNQESAQDLTQEVFIYALEHLDGFNWQGRSFGAWLFHIARKRVLQRHWRSGRQRSEAVYAQQRQRDGDRPGADADLARDELLARVRGLIGRFDDDRHDVFVLHVFMEIPVRDTALALGMPENTVKSHLLRGRGQLAAWLGDDAALTEAERRDLREALASEQGLDVLPAPEPRRARRHADEGRSPEGMDRDEDGGRHD